MSRARFSLIVITPEKSHEQELGIIKSLMQSGRVRIHVRKPGFSQPEYKHYLNQFDEEELKHMVIHEFPELYQAFPALGGVHLKSTQRISGGKVDKRSGIVSSGFHSLEDLDKEGAAFEYAFLSPVFDSISKAGYKAAYDLGVLSTKLASLKLAHPSLQVIALGGITKANIDFCRKAGFDGVAVLGALWTNENPEQYARDLVIFIDA